MAPKKAVEKKDEKPKPPPMSAEMKELKERQKNLVKVPQPDRTELDETAKKVQDDINVLQEKLKKHNDLIASKSVGKEEHFKARDEIRAKLDEYSGKIDALQKQKEAIRGGLKDAKNEARDKSNRLKDMKKKLGFETEGEIDQRIKEIETQMYTESMTLKKEKELMDKIKELRKSKPEVQKLRAMEGNLGGAGDGEAAAKGGLDDLQAQLTELFEAKKLQSQAYTKLMEARQKVMVDVPKLFEEREVINAQIREKIVQRNKDRDEFYLLMKDYNTYLSESRDIRNQLGRLERDQRQAEWEAKKKDEADDAGPAALPFDDDLQYLDNIKKYLSDYMPKEAVKEAEKAVAAVPKDAGAAGHMVLMSKGQRDEEFFFAPTKMKQLKKKGTAKAKPIVHSMETLSFFDKYKLPTPADSAAVPATLKAVEEKIVEYKAKQVKRLEDDKKKAEKKDDAPAEGEEAAAEKTEE